MRALLGDGRFGPCVRISIRQPLANHALKGLLSPLRVVHAQRRAFAVAEIELRQIAVEVLFAAVLIDAPRIPRLKMEKKPSIVFVVISGVS